MLKHILIIANPSSGKKKGRTILEEVEVILTKKNYEIDVLMTEYRKHAQQFMTSSRIAHYDFIIVIGGDGTLHEVINGLLNRKDDLDIPIGVMGGGTGNALLTELNRNTLTVQERIDEMLKEKEEIKLDVGLVSYRNNSGLEEQTYFFNLIGLGLAVESNKTAELMRRRCSFLGQLRYVCGVLCSLCRNRSYEVDIMRDNQEAYYSYFTNCVFIQNTMHCGDRLKLAPEAKIDDGLFDLVFNIKMNRKEMYSLVKKIEKAKKNNEPYDHTQHEKVKYFQFQNLRLKSREPLDLNIDGENYGTTDLQVNVHNRQVTLI